jgi:hypothetical protein
MRCVGVFLFALILGVTAGPARAQSVLTYHGDAARSGHFIVPGLTSARAKALRLDPDFHAELAGHIYAQPLYWQPPGGAPLLIAVTEKNLVYALDPHSGRTIWTHRLGPPVEQTSLPCGDIVLWGATGTPAIDAESGTLYVDAPIAEKDGPRHFVFALDLKDGSVRPGWPVDLAQALADHLPRFDARIQNERGALLIAHGSLYVPFSGQFGDCGPYHGWVAGISLADPQKVVGWATRAQGGGIWAQGGVVFDGKALFVATGNTKGATEWADGEAVIRFPFDLRGPKDLQDFFTPGDWSYLDETDTDLGSTAPLFIDVPSEHGMQRLVLVLGKDGKAYLLDHDRLGGIGGALDVAKVAAGGIFAAAATYRNGNAAYVAFSGSGLDCPSGESGRGLTVAAIHAGSPPKLATVWCAPASGIAAPIVTTTDGTSNPIVWSLSVEGVGRLSGFDGETGEMVFNGPPAGLQGLHRFQTLIATQDRLYVGADGTIYAFVF